MADLKIDDIESDANRRMHGRFSIIREFSYNTSSHGIPGIARSESIGNRIFWTICMIVFSGVMLYFIVGSIKAYFQYPTQTSVSVVVERLQVFPAVSICNFSPIRADTFVRPFLEFTRGRNSSVNLDGMNNVSVFQVDYVLPFFKYLFDERKQLENFFFSLNSMLISCIYNGRTCYASDFISFLSSAYGMCYTFNAKMKTNESAVRNTADHGGIGKLELKLYAHGHQYVPYVAGDAAAGMMVMIHDNTDLPLIELGGIELAAGRRHKLSYKKRKHQLLPHPYSDCTTKIPLGMRKMFDQYEGAAYEYSQVICNTLCKQAYVYQQCKCVDPSQWTARSVVLPGSNESVLASICAAKDPCYSNATERITKTSTIWDEFCGDCSRACSTVDFITTASSISAPSPRYSSLYKSFVEDSGVPLPMNWTERWEAEVQHNYVAVDIVSETTLVETYVQDSSMSGIDLLSNVGGHTGLWIGISFLSIMEFIEMLYRLLRYECYSIRLKFGRTLRKSLGNS